MIRPVALWLVLLAAAGTFALASGNRLSMGLFVGPLNTSTGLGLGSISLAFAVGQIWWGLVQPFAGAAADRFGTGRVILVGVLLLSLGTFVTPYMTSTAGLVFAIGLVSMTGAGLIGPPVLMAATSRLLAPAKHAIANGVVNAGGSLGQFLLAPLAGGMIATLGWGSAMQVLALLVLLALPAAYLLRGTARHATAPSGTPVLSSMDAVRTALRHPSYLMLAAGFFVCGFHVAFLATHLPGVIAACGLPPQTSGWALGVLGLFNIVGSVTVGWAMGRWRMKSLLSLIYAARGLAVLLFLFAPKTELVLLIFSAVMGLTFLSTVPPTAGLVARFFGLSNMAMLFGIVMLSHQIGAFLGAWLGGRVFEATGSYDWVWYIDIVLAVGAALVHLPIREARLSARMATA